MAGFSAAWLLCANLILVEDDVEHPVAVARHDLRRAGYSPALKANHRTLNGEAKSFMEDARTCGPGTQFFQPEEKLMGTRKLAATGLLRTVS